MELQDVELVERAQKGSRGAFSQLVLRYEGLLIRMAMSLLGDPEDAADVVQEAVLDAWQGITGLRRPQYFKTWLVRILFRKCAGILKDRKKHRHGELEETAGFQGEGDWEQSMDVREALDRLGPEDRLLLGLYYGDGFSVKEIAKALRIGTGAAKTRLFRSRERFRRIYEKYEKKEGTGCER